MIPPTGVRVWIKGRTNNHPQITWPKASNFLHWGLRRRWTRQDSETINLEYRIIRIQIRLEIQTCCWLPAPTLIRKWVRVAASTKAIQLVWPLSNNWASTQTKAIRKSSCPNRYNRSNQVLDRATTSVKSRLLLSSKSLLRKRLPSFSSHRNQAFSQIILLRLKL